MSNTHEQERYCPQCSRVYSTEDWQEDNCPFCDVPLKAVSGDAGFLDDTLSQDLPWPQGEKEAVVCKASGYIDAQMTKAQLESAGIPVLLHAGAKLGLTIGDLGAVPVMVPKSRLEEAKKIVFGNNK